MNRTIKINQPINAEIGASIEVLLSFLEKTNAIKQDDKVTIDLSAVNFAYPFFTLPIASIINALQVNGIETNIIPSQHCSSYLSTIRFPQGFEPIENQEWAQGLEYYRQKTYLPVCNIPIKNSQTRNDLLSTFENILKQQLGIKGQLSTVISYLISEAMDNISDHANIENGWIMIQNYPTKGFLDICITDTGIGIWQSYQNCGNKNINSHASAIKEAINGHSTKDYRERGFGLSTSRKMLVEGLNGSYFLFSGSAFYIWNQEFDQINAINVNNSWQGTMLALRIPKNIPEDFNYITYLE